MWYVYTSDVHSAILAINMAANVETELDIIHDTDENWEFYKNFYSKITESIFYIKNIYICSDKILTASKQIFNTYEI